MESIGSLIFLVMILAVSINQGQTGNNLILGAFEPTQDGGQPGALLTSQARQEIDEYQNHNDKKLTVEKLRSASTHDGNEITSVIDRALKYLAGTYEYALAAVRK